MKNIIQCLLLAVGCAAMPLAAAPTTPVVIGTDLRITQGELDKAYETYVLTQLAFAGVEVSPVFEKSIRKALLDDLIMNRLTAQRADATDLSKADLKATENYKDQRANWPTDLAFELVVDATGLTMVEFKRQLQQEALRLIVARRELHALTSATEGDILKYYNDNRERWKVPGTAKVAQIFLSKFDLSTGRKLNPKERAAKHQLGAELAAKAGAGVDFKKLVADFSEDPISQPNHGEFEIVKGFGNQDLEREVFGLRVNNVKLIETELGFHVVWVKEIKLAKVKGRKEVSNDIRKYLQAKKFREELPKYFERIKKQAGVRILLN